MPADRDLEIQKILNTIGNNILIRARKTPPRCTLSTRLIADIVGEEVARGMGGASLNDGGPNLLDEGDVPRQKLV